MPIVYSETDAYSVYIYMVFVKLAFYIQIQKYALFIYCSITSIPKLNVLNCCCCFNLMVPMGEKSKHGLVE